MTAHQLIWLAMVLILCCCEENVSAAPATQPGLPPHTVCDRDVKYGDGPAKSNLMDIFLPDNADKPLPLVVWVHGGGWIEGSKEGCPALPLVARGYIVASINYRLSKQAVYPAQIQDCKGAIRFLRAHARDYHIDPDRVGVWGASAGGHLVALLGTSVDSKELEGDVGGNLDQSSRVQAVCDWFGPTDLTQFAEQAVAAGILKTTPGPSLIMQLFGGTLKEKHDLVQQANPIAFIDKKTAKKIPPFLIMHGDKDTMVPVAQSQLLKDALADAGVSVELQVIHGGGHGGKLFSTPKAAKSIADFFDKNLKPN
jgi:acetyl esterase/lipase